MPSLIARVRRTIRRHDLVPRGARVVVALSGGSDSIALLYLLLEMQRESDLYVAGIAHLNHQLRGRASDQDEAFCRIIAESTKLPIVVDAVDVAAVARRSRQSVEATARRLRYEFLHRAAVSLAADRIAVGHTRNDQAETFLLRMLRGAGPGGLAGIRPRAGLVVRPLLDVERVELHAYLTARGAEFRDDASNRDVAFVRNRVRHELLPLLRDRFSPGIVKTLSREAEIAREDADYLNQLVVRAQTTVMLPNTDRVVIDVPALRACPPPIARRVVRAAMQLAAPDHFIGFDAVDAVLALTDKLSERRRVDGPGQRAERCGETVVLTPKRGRLAAAGEPQTPPFSYWLNVPGEVLVGEAGCQISAEVVPSAAQVGSLRGRRDWAAVAAAPLSGRLMVRNRHHGDVFRPLGLHGRKKLQDFFVDRRVRRPERDRVPLVVDGQNRIVWVAGHAVGEEFRVTDPGKPVVILRMTHLGGEG